LADFRKTLALYSAFVGESLFFPYMNVNVLLVTLQTYTID